MNISSAARVASRAWFRAACALLLSLGATLAFAQADPPGRVGRLAEVQGNVSWFDHQQGQWAQAERNLPLTGGDRIATDGLGRVELRIGSTVLRVGGGSEIEVLRLDDQRISVQLHSGSLALRVRSREIAQEVELVTAEARFVPNTAGHFRLDRVDDTTQLSSWRGEIRIDDRAGFVLVAGQRADLYRQGGELRMNWGAPASDAFAQWVGNDEQRDERSASVRYVSPEMTGVEDLDRNGRWEQHPEFGAVWLPLEVRADWAPYRYGRWTWVRPWGWTWVDDTRWGFAPFHYGRWAHWRGRWCWVPGAYAVRPVYAPALVAWVGGPPGVSIDIRIGGGFSSIGWVALAPREVYVPRYVVTPGYHDRINPEPSYRWQHPPRHVHTGPIMYGNQGVPNGVTVVSNDVLLQRRPVGREWEARRDDRHVDDRRPDGRRAGPALDFRQQPLVAVAPPTPTDIAPPVRAERPPLQMVPGGGQAPMVQRPQVRPPPQQQPSPQQQPQPAPSWVATQPQTPTAPVVVPDDRRERHERHERDRPVQQPQPRPQPQPQQQSQPQPQATMPAPPVVTAPPAPPPQVVRPQPVERVSAPERARERDRERETREPERKRGQEGHQNQRERENLR
jgi:hypothetical protein